MVGIQIFNTISEKGLNLLPSDIYQTVKENPDAIILRSHKLNDMTVPPQLKAIARAGAGVNNIPVDMLTAKGIPVFNTPGANANAVKELVVAGLLLSSRHICQAWQQTSQLTGDDVDVQVENLKKEFKGQELPGKTLGVIGLGAIGVRVANIALSLGMSVIAYDPRITIKNAWQLSAEVEQAKSMQEVISNADFVTPHVPYNDKTHHLISDKVIKAMKPNAVLLNFSRAKIVDEKAVLSALNDNKIAHYVSDFPNEALLKNNKTICLPHLGASTEESEDNCAVMAVKNLRNFLEHGIIESSVNFPEINMPYQGGTRIAIANHNVPNMLGQISQAIANAKLNILDMINRSKGDVAYTLVDVDGNVDKTLIDDIAKVDGVLNCRKVK